MFLLPTLNRPKLLSKFLESAIAAKTTHPGRILIDAQDFKANDEYKNLPAILDWEIIVTQGVTMAEKVREVWPLVQDKQWVGILNDDFEVVTYEWDLILLSKLDGTNVVSSNDRKQRSFMKPSGATVWSMDLIKALGWNSFFPPNLNHLYIDDIWLQLGFATGCWAFCPQCIVLHKHVLDGEMEQDSTFRKTYDDYFKGKSRDKDVFDLFMKHDFPKAVEAIKDLRSGPQAYKHQPIVSRA